MSRSKKILGPESSPSVGRRLIKFPSSKLKKFIVKPDLSRQECITQICPVSSLQLNRNSLRLRALQPHHADGMADGMADLFSLVNLTWLLWINDQQISCIGRNRPRWTSIFCNIVIQTSMLISHLGKKLASRHHGRGLQAHPPALCPETLESHQPPFRQ